MSARPPALSYGIVRVPGTCDACGATGVQGPTCPRCGASMDIIQGAVLAGRYRADSLLGQGGFGRVYHGVDLGSGLPVAIKVLRDEVAANAEFRTRFQREAVVMSRLRHPGIVAIYAFGEHAGLPYLVMEFVHGRPLSTFLQRNQVVFPYIRTASLMDQMLGTLEAAHRGGVVHRDVKPGNVMMVSVPVSGIAQPATAGGSSPPPPMATIEAVKLLDFGLAFFEETPPELRVTSTQTTFGSPYYMSPEQCRGRDVGTPTDIYAAGVMFYEMLSGAPPFLGRSASEVTAQHMYVPPPPIAEHGARQQAPEHLEAIARWALAKRPEDRPTASQFRAALAQAVQRMTAPAAGPPRRGLGGADTTTATLVRTPTMRPEGPRVVLWGLGDARAAALRDALAVNGVHASPWRAATPPVEPVDGKPPQAVLVPGDAYAAERVRALRARPGGPPVLVIDLPDAAATPGLIRAGASDVALAAVADDAICAKVWRAIRRGR